MTKTNLTAGPLTELLIQLGTAIAELAKLWADYASGKIGEAEARAEAARLRAKVLGDVSQEIDAWEQAIEQNSAASNSVSNPKG